MPATRSSARSDSPYQVDGLVVAIHRSPLGAWWRWRTELTALLLVAGSFFYGWYCLGTWVKPLLILAAVVLVVALVPHSRRLVLARFWVLFTRHRLQRAFWELRLHTRAGRLPLIIWMRATPVGSRAWVILRAGMTFEDFENAAAAFATACGARDCRVTASPRWAWLVCIDLMRRDVLGGRVIRSPLGDLPGLPELGPGPGSHSDTGPVWPESALVED